MPLSGGYTKSKNVMKRHKLLLLLAGGLMVASVALADDNANQMTLTGMLVCGKCTLHITKKCQNVLEVPQNGTNVLYFLTQNDVSKDFHQNICQNSGEKVTVTGTVKEKHGKEVLTATKIEPVK